MTFQAAAQTRACSGDILLKKSSAACSKDCMEPYKRLAAILSFNRRQIPSAGFRCEQYLAK